jgi:hypothetical protein
MQSGVYYAMSALLLYTSSEFEGPEVLGTNLDYSAAFASMHFTILTL